MQLLTLSQLQKTQYHLREHFLFSLSMYLPGGKECPTGTGEFICIILASVTMQFLMYLQAVSVVLGMGTLKDRL